jgi:hypothetical protein
MTENILQEKLNKILVDIVSVTDEVRREQLQDEYFEVEAALIELSTKEKEVRDKQEGLLIKENELDIYKNLYKETSLVEALENINNINVSEICKKFKLRPLTNLENTRTLIPFLSAVNATLVIKDMEDVLVDSIGKGEKEYTVNIFCLSKNKLDMRTCVRFDIIKE